MWIIFTTSLMSSFMCSHYRDYCASSLIFSVPIWWLWNCSNALDCNWANITICLTFIITPSNITSLPAKVKSGQVSCIVSALLDGQFSITYSFRSSPVCHV